MRAGVRFSTISRFAGVMAAAWLCGTGSAWAATAALTPVFKPF